MYTPKNFPALAMDPQVLRAAHTLAGEGLDPTAMVHAVADMRAEGIDVADVRLMLAA